MGVLPGPCPKAEGGRGSFHPAGGSTPPSPKPAGLGALRGSEKALSHVQGTRPPESRAFGARGCGSAWARPRLQSAGAWTRGCGGARGARYTPLPTARPLASSVARSFGPKCSGCQRLTSPLPAGSGDRGRGHPQKGPERPPARGLCPSSCTFSPPCPLKFSSFICCPRSSPFQRPICRPPPPPPFLFLPIHPPVFGLSPLFPAPVGHSRRFQGARWKGTDGHRAPSRVPLGPAWPRAWERADIRRTTLIQTSLLRAH